MSQADEKAFERETIDIARHKWPTAIDGGSERMQGHEVDGVFRTDETIHLVEVTVSRTRKKAAGDIGDLVKLAKKLKKLYPMHAIKGWFITKHEPTEDQRKCATDTNGLVVAVSYNTFRGTLVDAETYLRLRRGSPFGSMLDYDGKQVIKRFSYVDRPLYQVKPKEEAQRIGDLARRLEEGGRLVVLGDYGSGKSTSLHELFLRLTSRYSRGLITRFPIYLNLREHGGQTDPAEALERHATLVGYPEKSHLVRAWRSGYAILLIDGFDEVASSGWAGIAKKLRDLRFRAMELPRKLIAETPDGAGLLIAGRHHFFDGRSERENALRLRKGDYSEYQLADFDEAQAEELLKLLNVEIDLPEWLPRRPLLLWYLATRDVLVALSGQAVGVSPVDGWQLLLAEICEREARIEAGIDGAAVRRVVETLATVARRSANGLGPIDRRQMFDAFEEVCGYAPDDHGAVVLQRLPGLGPVDNQDGTRRFVDAALVDAARVGDIERYLGSVSGYRPPLASDWQCSMGSLGLDILAGRCDSNRLSDKQLSHAVSWAKSRLKSDVLAGDIVLMMLRTGRTYEGEPVELSGLDLEDVLVFASPAGFGRVVFRECVVAQLDLEGADDLSNGPLFRECYIGHITGKTERSSLPTPMLDDSCQVESYDSEAKTTAALLDLSLGPQQKVRLTILKKIFMQAGAGRQERALFRGLDQRHQQLVPDEIRRLSSAGFIVGNTLRGTKIWHPIPRMRERVVAILSAKGSSDDPVMDD